MLDARDTASNKTQFLPSQNVLSSRLLIQCRSCNHSVILGGQGGHGRWCPHRLREDCLLEKMPSKQKPGGNGVASERDQCGESLLGTDHSNKDPQGEREPSGEAQEPRAEAAESAGTTGGVFE